MALSTMYNTKTKINYIESNDKLSIQNDGNKYKITSYHSLKKYFRESNFYNDCKATGNYGQCLNKYCDFKWSIVNIFNKNSVKNLSIDYDTPHICPHIKLKYAIVNIQYDDEIDNNEIYREKGFIKNDKQLGRIFIDNKYIIVCRATKIEIYNNKTMEKIHELEIIPSLLIFTLNDVTITHKDIAHRYNRDFNLIEKKKVNNKKIVEV